MTMLSMQPEKVDQKELGEKLRALVKDQGVSSCLGIMPSTKGTFVLLFSHRFNKEFSLLISGHQLTEVRDQVSKILEREDA